MSDEDTPTPESSPETTPGASADTPGPAPADTPDSAPAAAAEPAEALADLQHENDRLRGEIDSLAERHRELATREQRLEQAEDENLQLRRRYANVALRQSLAEAAANVHLPASAVEMFAHRFRCEIGRDGQPHIEPNPTEFLLKELQTDPLLRQAAERTHQQRQADHAARGAADPAESDPAELLRTLDRHPARKARFIRTHGTQAYVTLARRARQQAAPGG